MALEDLSGLTASELEEALTDYLDWDPQPPREDVARIAAEAIRRAHEAERHRDALDLAVAATPTVVVEAREGRLT